MKKILFVCLLMISIVLSAQIKLGAGSTDTGNAPVNSGFTFSYSQQIYTKQEINADAAGNITGLKFYLTPSANPSYLSNWVVYLGHTTKNSLDYQIGWIPVGEMTQVYSGTVTNVNGVVEVTFATPFPYDNVRNLVVAVDENGFNSNSNNPFFVYNTMEQALYTESNTVNADPANPPIGHFLPYKPVVSLMGLVPNLLPDCPIISYPANNASSVPVLPNFTWAAVQGATSYKVSVGTTAGGTDIVNQQSVTTTNFTPSSPLLASTVYYLKVIAVGSTGESSGCVNQKFTTVQAIPFNDECINAITLSVNPDLNCVDFTSGTTVMSTVSSPTSSCGTSTGDVWYKFIATSVTHTVNLKNVTSVPLGGGYVYFQVLKGDCGNLTSILCSGSDCGYMTSASCPLSIVNNLTVGETYYIKVFSGSGYSSHKFEICVGTLPATPSNDECTDAVNVPVNTGSDCINLVSGTTLSSTFSPLSICDSLPRYDVWYKFTATDVKHIIKIKNVIPVGLPNNLGGLAFHVFGGSCGNFVCKGGGGTSGLVDGLTAGETYYLKVFVTGGIQASGFNFDLCISKDLTPIPVNDECVNAVSLVVNSDLTCVGGLEGNTLGATVSTILPTVSCGGTGVQNDVWFKFVATGTSHRISFKNIIDVGVSGTQQDIRFEIFKGSCGALTSVKCGGSVNRSSYINNVSGLVAGETYYIRAYSTGVGIAVKFNICVGTLLPPVNDDCTGALTVSNFPYTYTQIDAEHTTNNNGFINSCNSAMNDGTWFTFVGDGFLHKITVSRPLNSTFNFGIGAYKGNCGNLTCVKRVNFTGSSPVIMDLPTIAGNVYYINIGDRDYDTDTVEGVFTITIEKVTSLGTLEVADRKEAIEVYPNPFTSVLNISKADKVKSIFILDSSGRLIKNIEKPSSVLQLRDLKQGMYLVVLNMKDGSKQTIKAIKR
ncbi:T9SS type A sorting domain-containing protein [Chryseobacterium sp. JV558]|uniref:T9SS type A sorting domain-containing protein n=1 Tax=Chryseobacterium sp. JV558 TaxID=2663236 RepID=UPI00299EC7DE|nr:T9SS type A sorting domain-containing protein [Chryseobacterium sp. JV558]MDW9381813.1 T9SS type A sorting domain-containing protein [Chryseobacterium sp. JV558]